MNFMYMKNVMSQFKRENEGSVIAEVGSEHCHSDGHITDNEEGEAREERESHSESEINVLKECLVRQVPTIIKTFWNWYYGSELVWFRIRFLPFNTDP